MGIFFEKKWKFLIFLFLGIVFGWGIYFSLKPINFQKEEREECRLPDLPDGTEKIVTKIVDGDTFLIEGGYSVRVLGVDADEKDHPCYEAAKIFLENLILGKKVRLEKGREEKDKYCRYLRYVFVEGKNVSLELLKNGLAVARVSPSDLKYKPEIVQAEREAKEKKIGCKWGEKNFFWQNLTKEKTGLEVVEACQAEKYYGKEVIVEGMVVKGYRSKTNTVFLNFEREYPNQCFTAVIFHSRQGNFPPSPETFYENKKLRVRGVVKEYKGKPEIILENPSQVEEGK
jgi:micrococcal nuclease